jgi:hypothetical protein
LIHLLEPILEVGMSRSGAIVIGILLTALILLITVPAVREWVRDPVYKFEGILWSVENQQQAVDPRMRKLIESIPEGKRQEILQRRFAPGFRHMNRVYFVSYATRFTTDEVIEQMRRDVQAVIDRNPEIKFRSFVLTKKYRSSRKRETIDLLNFDF